jgi:hypothetical protein
MSDTLNTHYAWHGELVKVEFGHCHVKEQKEQTMWWYNYECRIGGNAVVEALKVTHEGKSFFIANHHGIGVHKLLNGGWPSHSHFGLPDGCFEPNEDLPHINSTVFDELAYSSHESARLNWQKENFPAEYEKMEALKAAFYKSKSR